MRSVAAVAILVTMVPLADQQRGSRAWRPEERVVIADFNYVQAIAATYERVYVASRGGLGVYDRVSRRWELPITPLDGYPSEQVLAALIDPIDRSLWLGTEAGVVHYDPNLRRFESTPIPGGVSQLVFDRNDALRGIFLRVRSGWLFRARGSFVVRPTRNVPPPSQQVRSTGADDVQARLPFAQALRSLTLTDRRLRQYRYTAGAFVPAAEEAFLGTSGLGLVRVDAATTDVELLPFGLLASPVGAVAPMADGVWVGSGARASRVGFTFVGRDVQRYRYREWPDGTGFQFREVRDIVVRNDEFIAATDMGVVSVRVGDLEPSRSLAIELPTPDVYSLALAGDELWIGTARGLVHVAADGALRRVGDARPILALGTLRDTLWAATPMGLRIAVRGGAGLAPPPGIDRTPQLADPVVAVAFTGDTVVAATQQRIIWRASGGQWVVERAMGELGELVALGGDQDGVWLAGSQGFAFYRFATRAFLTYNAPGDLAGRPRDLALHSGFLWVATDGGLVRFALDAVK